MRFSLRPILNGVIVCGVGLALWPLGQSAYGVWNQKSLAAQFKASQSVKTPATKPQKSAKTKRNSSFVSDSSPTLAVSIPSASRTKRAPWSLTKLSIPDINLETFIVQGMDEAALRRGPGHDINSSAPGAGNCVVAGHRNIYGSFFYRIDELMSGAPITLENRDGKWNYLVDTVYSTPDTNLTILQAPPVGTAPILTLITCTLPHTNNRIVLQAHLVE